jgi:hypothetical protein
MEIKRFSLVKPTLQTPFHIDFAWWKQYDSNWRVYLVSCLCAEHQQSLAATDTETFFDWIDPDTAEVQRVDGLQHILINHCAKLDGFVTSYTSLVDAVFRTLLANGNTPLTPEELSRRLNRPATTILMTLTGIRVYKGLRPISHSN